MKRVSDWDSAPQSHNFPDLVHHFHRKWHFVFSFFRDILVPFIQVLKATDTKTSQDIDFLLVSKKLYIIKTRLVICTSRTVGSAKKFVRITSGFGGGEFTKTLRKVCTCQKLKLAFLLLEYCKIRECYAVANTFTIRNMYRLLLYMKCSSRKINRPTKNITKIVTLLHF
jgi:hypothetical protein